jgi:hypothetical protein
MFVGGDPDLQGELASKPAGVGGFARMFLPAPVAEQAASPPPQPGEAWLIPADQLMCSERLVRAAQRAHRTVRLIDVNRPGVDRPLVEAFVTASDVLPIAVRSDGRRLVGAEDFAPGEVRRFLSGA